MIDQTTLKRILSYDPEIGEFRWRFRPEMGRSWNSRHAGQIAGSHTHDWYRKISISGCGEKGRNYYASHLAWLYMTGELPPKGYEVDHRDRNQRNDRWGNLRLATKSQNGFNQGLRRSNTSGFRGVSWNQARHRWVAYIDVDGKHKVLGRFARLEDAVAARARAVTELRPDWRPQYEPFSAGGRKQIGALGRAVSFPETFRCHVVRNCTTALAA